MLPVKKAVGLACLLIVCTVGAGQVKKIELYDLVKKLAADSALGGVGDWAVGNAAAYPIKWKSDMLEMSDDLKINFFRTGTANISVKGNIYQNAQLQPARWTLMLRGPRAGYTNFNISSESSSGIHAGLSLDSLFGNKPFTYKILKTCNANATAGFNYYQLKLPKKDPLWMKAAWSCTGSAFSISLDVYDDWSKSNADIACVR